MAKWKETRKTCRAAEAEGIEGGESKNHGLIF